MTPLRIEGQPIAEPLERIVAEVVAPSATSTDADGVWPGAAMAALGEAGLLGLISARDVGGMGRGIREAALVVERVARDCASTALVLCMHYAATAVIEAHGPRTVREAIAAGRHVSSLAFSEKGSRSHFWAPVSTAAQVAGNGHVRLDAQKSWITSAGRADSYVWSSRPVAAEGASTLWLVPSGTPGLRVVAPFNGLGLRGNASSPVTADGAVVDRSSMLGDDGAGFDVMMSVVLPAFQLMTSSVCLGIMEAAVSNGAAHLSSARLEHLGQSLADQPVARSYVARARIQTDMARGLVMDTVSAIEDQRGDAALRVLEVKAASAEAAIAVTDLMMRACGGAAFRKEVGVERNFRDARAITVMAPTTDALHDFIGRSVCGLPLFGQVVGQ